jgi:hypothetical protein
MKSGVDRLIVARAVGFDQIFNFNDRSHNFLSQIPPSANLIKFC